MSGTGDPIEIRQDIEATREELGETVEALAAKTDVGAQARTKLDQARSAARRNPKPLIAGAVIVGFFVQRRLRR